MDLDVVRCGRCLQEKPLTSFGNIRRTGKTCKDCHRARMHEWHRNHPDYNRKWLEAHGRKVGDDRRTGRPSLFRSVAERQEHKKEYMRRWRESHPNSAREWRSRNPNYGRQRKRTSPDKARVYNQKYRDGNAAELNPTPGEESGALRMPSTPSESGIAAFVSGRIAGSPFAIELSCSVRRMENALIRHVKKNWARRSTSTT